METTMTRISAVISQETQAQVAACAKHLGIRKAALIEQALQYHLQALREIPSEVMIPSRLVLDRASFEQVADRLARDEPPTDALRTLMQ
jgi:dihydrofolate reductase